MFFERSNKNLFDRMVKLYESERDNFFYYIICIGQINIVYEFMLVCSKFGYSLEEEATKSGS
jgi:hypothetical protein